MVGGDYFSVKIIKNVNAFMIDNNIYYQYKAFKMYSYFHLYDTSDYQTIQFNKFILNINQINHPILKYINNQDHNNKLMK